MRYLVPLYFLRVALSHLRNQSGMTISGYLDDNILVNYVDLLTALLERIQAAELFQKLGFTINIPERLIFPSTIIVHLGFIINSEMMQSLYDWGENTKRFGTNKTTT